MIIGYKFSICHTVLAHVEPGEFARLLSSNTKIQYLIEGYQHILPYGVDHILFILSLFLLSPRLKPVLWQATAFTIAHSITLGLAMYKIITPPLHIIEPLIALSIMYVAIENVFSSKLRPSRIGIVFLFGLVHGLGFAGALANMGLPGEHYFTCLVMFNLGVELGQITVILAAYFLLARWFADKPYYRKQIVIPLSVCIAVVACCWAIQRIFF
ncbi:HupE / UreJ protein [Chitinophaga sp. CF118]|uniref:HupE/UreJ family protein n=1 Tax=Chitinophaga sp. CF118 TaxID=1884367 RepID=UPI0008F2F593|nr:HupE/UreJ family protein [Chitinophaga sp. CF118]SFD59768.1 HupE / UreJ protein [Chitinophaga sp. CF118]